MSSLYLVRQCVIQIMLSVSAVEEMQVTGQCLLSLNRYSSQGKNEPFLKFYFPSISLAWLSATVVWYRRKYTDVCGPNVVIRIRYVLLYVWLTVYSYVRNILDIISLKIVSKQLNDFRELNSYSWFPLHRNTSVKGRDCLPLYNSNASVKGHAMSAFIQISQTDICGWCRFFYQPGAQLGVVCQRMVCLFSLFFTAMRTGWVNITSLV